MPLHQCFQMLTTPLPDTRFRQEELVDSAGSRSPASEGQSVALWGGHGPRVRLSRGLAYKTGSESRPSRQAPVRLGLGEGLLRVDPHRDPGSRVASPGGQSRDPMPPREAQACQSRWDRTWLSPEIRALPDSSLSLTPGPPLLPRLPSGWPKSILGDRQMAQQGARWPWGAHSPAQLASQPGFPRPPPSWSRGPSWLVCHHPPHLPPPLPWTWTPKPPPFHTLPCPLKPGTSFQALGLPCLSSDSVEKPAVPWVQHGAVAPGPQTGTGCGRGQIGEVGGGEGPTAQGPVGRSPQGYLRNRALLTPDTKPLIGLAFLVCLLSPPAA